MESRVNEKRERFIRLAERRTNAVIQRIRILSNCSNANAYEYSDTDVEQIFGAIDEELNRARAKFATSKHREFRLKHASDRQEGEAESSPSTGELTGTAQEEVRR